MYGLTKAMEVPESEATFDILFKCVWFPDSFPPAWLLLKLCTLSLSREDLP